MGLPALNRGAPEHTLRFSFSWGKAVFDRQARNDRLNRV